MERDLAVDSSSREESRTRGRDGHAAELDRTVGSCLGHTEEHQDPPIVDHLRIERPRGLTDRNTMRGRPIQRADTLRPVVLTIVSVSELDSARLVEWFGRTPHELNDQSSVESQLAQNVGHEVASCRFEPTLSSDIAA
jgi:hypothetical protein